MPKLYLTRINFIKFVWFNVGGLVFFVSGYAVFAALYGVLHWHWLMAKVIADLVGWSLNYIVQHYWAFDGRAYGHKRVLKRFVPFSLMNFVIDYSIVGVLKAIGVTPFLGLCISSLFFTVWKWLGYKHWVFKMKA